MTDEKKLFYVPILHMAHDMGSLADSLKKTYVKKFGEKRWHAHVRAIEEMWAGIRKKIEGLALLPHGTIKLYQDGLPLCGKEQEIVNEVAASGSLNHQLLQWLMGHGAELVGTEDPVLLLEEYNRAKEIIQARTHAERERLSHHYEQGSDDLLKKRDQFISKRIEETLGAGETGFLFIGLLHKVDELLPQDISVHYIIHRLPFKGSLERGEAGG